MSVTVQYRQFGEFLPLVPYILIMLSLLRTLESSGSLETEVTYIHGTLHTYKLLVGNCLSGKCDRQVSAVSLPWLIGPAGNFLVGCAVFRMGNTFRSTGNLL